jgi:hypothetical protein
VLIALIFGFSIFAKLQAPDKNIADGVYRNECCSDIIIKDGHISQRDKTFDFKLLNMKFGLTGYVSGRFTREGMQESDQETAITFLTEGGRRALSLPIDQHEYTFRIVGSAESSTAR